MSGVEICPVAEVRKYMRHFRKRRLAYPRGSLPPHLAGGLGVLGIDRGRHDVAADSGQRETTFRHLGGGIVRATRTVVSRARRRADRFFQYRFLGLQKTQTRLDEIALMKACDAPGDYARDLGD